MCRMSIKLKGVCLAAWLGFGCVAFAAEEALRLPPLPDQAVERIAFGSCAKHWQAQPIWASVLKQDPDLWLFLGDNIYADTDGKSAWQVSEDQLNGEWARLADKPEFQAFRSKVPMLATWDNHDYGSHAGGAEFAGKHFSQQAFLRFFQEPEASPRWQQAGIYQSVMLGPEGRRVQIILLDTKFNRSVFRKNPMPKEERLKLGRTGGYLPDEDPQKTMLGAEQWAWLETELKKAAYLRILCSSIQVIPDQKGMDEWGNFPLERARLLSLLKESGPSLILSGNVHFAEVSKDPESGLVEFTSSGLTHINTLYGESPNPKRLGEAVLKEQAGLLRIDWEARQIDLQVIPVDGELIQLHRLSFDGQTSERSSRP